MTDHHSLKELLTQVIQTPEQQMYLAHLMGYDYCIKYRSGSTNTVANALSRTPYSSLATLLVLSVPCLTFLDKLKKHLLHDPQFVQLWHDIQAHPDNYSDYSITQDLIMNVGRMWLPRGFHFIPTLLVEYHSTPSGGHMGAAKMVAQLIENFTW